MFLRTGGGARERAGDLRRILEIAPNPEAGKAAVRNYLVADAARTAPDGRVNAPALRRWIDDRKDIWSEFPEMETEFRGTLRNAISGRENVTKLQQDLTRSEEHTSELQSLMRHYYGASCVKKK